MKLSIPHLLIRCLLAVVTMISPPLVADAAPALAIHLEAKDGELVDTTVQSSLPGYTGTGYVDGFVAPDAAVLFHHVQAAAGIYDLRVRYSVDGGKGIDFVVDGHKISAMLNPSKDAFTTQSVGEIQLAAGDNEIEIHRGWGYFLIDSLDLVPAPPPHPLKPIRAAPVDPDATPEARRLLQHLERCYGAVTLSGQHNIGDAEAIQQATGVSPAIVSGDLIEYSPSRVAHGAHADPTTEQLIQEAREGHILSVMWHWNAPTDLIDKKTTDAQGKVDDQSWYLGFYTHATTFDLANALDNPQSDDYRLLLSDMDTIAVQLEKLQAAHIPVLWRPLHEAEGGWFWWGAKGPEPFKRLWSLMYHRFTVTHHLHNLIWIYTSGGDPAWYPGDSMVDIVGTDIYPDDITDPLSGSWNKLLQQYDGRKMVALSEFGGVPDVDRARLFGVRWLYFLSWQGDAGWKKVPPGDLSRLYHEPYVLNKTAGTSAIAAGEDSVATSGRLSSPSR